MFRRYLESRLAGTRRLANDVVQGLDDRSKLFALELAAEQRRLIRLVIMALGALVVSILALVWAAATLVALTWDTEWRHATLLGTLAAWVIFAIVLSLKAKGLLESTDQAFKFTRQVAADDFDRLRETLK